MDWYPNKRLGLLWGLGLIAPLLLADYLLVRGALGMPVGLALFFRGLEILLALALTGLLVYAWYALATLTYRVERNGIMIRWGLVRDLVPMSRIEAIVPLTAVSDRLPRGLGWPGYRVGQVEIEGVGPVRLYVSGPWQQALLVRTRRRAYLITPTQVDGFLADYRARRTLGAIAEWPQRVRLPGVLSLSIWRDRLLAGLFLPGILLNVGLFGHLAARYPHLPPRMVLSLDAQGFPNRIGARWELWLVPVIGLGILVINALLAVWVHRRERVLALLLAGNVPLVQALAWVAVARLMG